MGLFLFGKLFVCITNIKDQSKLNQHSIIQQIIQCSCGLCCSWLTIQHVQQTIESLVAYLNWQLCIKMLMCIPIDCSEVKCSATSSVFVVYISISFNKFHQTFICTTTKIQVDDLSQASYVNSEILIVYKTHFSNWVNTIYSIYSLPTLSWQKFNSY